METINTAQGEKCPHETVNDDDKSKVMVYCDIKDKTYYFGQRIVCDYK